MICACDWRLGHANPQITGLVSSDSQWQSWWWDHRALEDGWLEPAQEEPDDHGSSLLLTSRNVEKYFSTKAFLGKQVDFNF
jgi:hypothetical protein